MALTRRKNKHAEDGDADLEKQRQGEEEKKSRSMRCPLFLVLVFGAWCLVFGVLVWSLDQVLTDVCLEWDGEEYDVLLRYVADQSEKLKIKKDDDDEDDDEHHKYVRKWYMPWKKTRVDQKVKKVGWACTTTHLELPRI